MNADTPAPGSPPPSLPSGLPSGSHIERLPRSHQPLLLVPKPADDASDAVSTATQWVAEASALSCRDAVALPVLLRLYNVDLVWSPERAAAVAAEERFAGIQDAVDDFSTLDAELAAIEAAVAAAWPAYEADLPYAYGFSEASISARDELLARYSSVKSLQGKLARLTRRITQPAPQPPTLAGQIGERLRERLRVEEREEAVDGELEVLSDHYDACGQRASDYAIARRENILSWTIIVLLSTETLLFAIELLSSAGT